MISRPRVGIGAVVSTKFTWPRDREAEGRASADGSKGGAMAQVDRTLQRQAAARRATTGATSTTSASTSPKPMSSRKDGRCYYAFYADAGTARSSCAGSATGATGCADYWTGRSIGSASAVDNRLSGARSSVSCCWRQRRSMRHDGGGRRRAQDERGKAWLLYAFATTILWGFWGAFTDLSARTRLSRHAGLLRLVAHDDPAGALCAGAQRLAARSRSRARSSTA